MTRATVVTWESPLLTRGCCVNESVHASFYRLTDNDDVVNDFPELAGALYISSIYTRAGGGAGIGRASAVLRTLLTACPNDTFVLTPAASGSLSQSALISWYSRYGFHYVDGVMIRYP